MNVRVNRESRGGGVMTPSCDVAPSVGSGSELKRSIEAPAPAVRLHPNLTELYRLLALQPPAELLQPISHGGGEPEAGGAMRRAS